MLDCYLALRWAIVAIEGGKRYAVKGLTDVSKLIGLTSVNVFCLARLVRLVAERAFFVRKEMNWGFWPRQKVAQLAFHYCFDNWLLPKITRPIARLYIVCNTWSGMRSHDKERFHKIQINQVLSRFQDKNA